MALYFHQLAAMSLQFVSKLNIVLLILLVYLLHGSALARCFKLCAPHFSEFDDLSSITSINNDRIRHILSFVAFKIQTSF